MSNYEQTNWVRVFCIQWIGFPISDWWGLTHLMMRNGVFFERDGALTGGGEPFAYFES